MSCITFKGSTATKYRQMAGEQYRVINQPNQVVKRSRPLWKTIELLEEQTERTVTKVIRERVVPIRKHWRPYLKNRWGLNYYHFGVVLHLYKCGTEIREVQFIAGLLLDSERKSREIHQRRAKFQQGRLAESEFKRQLAGNQWLYGLSYLDNEMRGVLQ